MRSDAGTAAPEPSQQLLVPAWVAYAAVSTFPLAGAALIAGTLGAARLVAWLGMLLVAGLLVASLWVTLGPGPRNCSIGYLGNVGGQASDWFCRAGFGIGSIIGLAVLALLIRRAVALQRHSVRCCSHRHG